MCTQADGQIVAEKRALAAEVPAELAHSHDASILFFKIYTRVNFCLQTSSPEPPCPHSIPQLLVSYEREF